MKTQHLKTFRCQYKDKNATATKYYYATDWRDLAIQLEEDHIICCSLPEDVTIGRDDEDKTRPAFMDEEGNEMPILFILAAFIVCLIAFGWFVIYLIDQFNALLSNTL